MFGLVKVQRDTNLLSFFSAWAFRARNVIIRRMLGSKKDSVQTGTDRRKVFEKMVLIIINPSNQVKMK